MIDEQAGFGVERYGRETPVRSAHAPEGPFRALTGTASAALPQVRFPPLASVQRKSLRESCSQLRSAKVGHCSGTDWPLWRNMAMGKVAAVL